MEPDLFADTTNASPPTTEALRSPIEPPQGVPLYLGTSSWSSDDWRGTVYPVDAKSSDYLTHYAKRFTAVEIDMTFYRIPTPAMVQAWNQRTPADFRFAAKIPQVITHEKVLRDCQAELQQFIEVMSLLGDKLGPCCFSFPTSRSATFRMHRRFWIVWSRSSINCLRDSDLPLSFATAGGSLAACSTCCAPIRSPWRSPIIHGCHRFRSLCASMMW